MRLLITGTSGFIGTNLLLALKDRVEILGLDNRKPKQAFLSAYCKQIDILNIRVLETTVFEFNPDYIIHLAARTDLDGKSLEEYPANMVGVQNILEVAKKLSSLKKILIASSMLVCHTGYLPKNQFDYAPTTYYGESKVETEKIVWANKPQCDWAILRPTSIWGPWFDAPYRNFFDMMKHRSYFHIGHKSCTKTYGYIGNAIYQIEQILFSDTTDEKQKVFYLGDNPPIWIEDWANEIAHKLGYKVRRMPWWSLKMAAWCGDILKLLGFHFPMTSFRLKNMTTDNIIDLSATYKVAPNPPYSRIDGVKATLEWMKEH